MTCGHGHAALAADIVAFLVGRNERAIQVRNASQSIHLCSMSGVVPLVPPSISRTSSRSPMPMRAACLASMCATAAAFGLVPPPVQQQRLVAASTSAEPLAADRRGVLLGAAAALALSFAPESALASGGATAGKYTTIPIAKRRYFGRVKQGVFEFLAVGAAIKKGELASPDIQDFFADNIQVQSKRQKRQCLALDDKTCEVSEKYSSRWEDMKLSMFLLGNAFRMDSGKPPEKVKQVKEAKAFTAQVEKLRKATEKGDRKTAALSYAAALEALEIYLNDVELPPTFAPDYAGEADMNVPSLCQGSFCI